MFLEQLSFSFVYFVVPSTSTSSVTHSSDRWLWYFTSLHGVTIHSQSIECLLLVQEGHRRARALIFTCLPLRFCLFLDE